jgi:hypothetical protein
MQGRFFHAATKAMGEAPGEDSPIVGL